MGVYDYSTTANSNTSVGGVSIAEGMNPSAVNNAIRAEMADAKKFANDISGENVSSGTDTITLTSDSTISAYADGMRFTFIAGGANTGPATLNIDSVGAKAVVKGKNTALAAGDIIADMACDVVYDASEGSGSWKLLNPFTGTQAYLTASSTATLTNKTIDAAGTGNSITNLAVSNFAGAAVVTEGEGINSSDNDTSIPTSAAVKDYAIAGALLTTRGDIIYRDASAPARLAKGTAGQVLTMGEDDPEWADPASGGVAVMSLQSADYSTTSTSESDITGLSFAIGAGETWDFIVHGIYELGNGTTLTLDVTGPASPSSVTIQAVSSLGGLSTKTKNSASGFGTDMALQTGSSGIGIVTVSGRVVNGSNAGTVQVRGKRSAGSNTAALYQSALFATAI